MPQTFQRSRAFHDVATIKRIVSHYYGFQVSAMTSRARTEPLATVRQLAMYLSSEITKTSSVKLAKCFARLDHSTILHACQTIPDKLSTDSKLKAECEILRDRIETVLSEST